MAFARTNQHNCLVCLGICLSFYPKVRTTRRSRWTSIHFVPAMQFTAAWKSQNDTIMKLYVRKSFYEFLHIVFQQFFHPSHCNILAFYSFSSLFEIRTLCSYEQHFKCTCRNSACKSHEIHQQNCTDSLATAHRNHSFIHLRTCFILDLENNCR